MAFANNNKKPQSFFATVRELAVLLLVVFIIRTVGFGLYQVPSGSMEPTMLVGERFFADKLSYWFVKPKRGDIIAINDPTYQYSDNALKKFYQEYVWGPTNWTKRVIGTPGDHIKGVIENGKPVVYRNGEKLEESYVNPYPLIQVLRVDPKEFFDLVRRGVSPDCLIDVKTYDPAKPYDQQPFYFHTIKSNRVIHEDFPNNTGTIPLIEPGTALQPKMDVSQYSDDRDYWTSSDVFNVHLGPNQYWLMGDNRLGSKDSRFFGPIDGRLIHGRILWRIWSSDSNESWWIFDLLKHPIDFWKKVRWSRSFQFIC